MIPYHPSGILLICLASELVGDASVSRSIGRRLAKEPNIDIIEAAEIDVTVMDAWEDAEAVILVDAMKSGGEPGAVLRLDAQDGRLPSGVFHDQGRVTGLAESIETARQLDLLPPRLLVFGIEVGNTAPGFPISPRVSRAATAVTAHLRTEIVRLKSQIRREYSLIQDLLKKINAVAKEQRPARVIGITVCLGALSHISPDHFREHFEQATRGTDLEGVSLEVEQLSDETGPEAEDIVLDCLELED